MTEIVLHDIDQVLVDRIKRVAGTRGWTVPRNLLHLLEPGLHVYDGVGSVHFDNSENDVPDAAHAQLQDIPLAGRLPLLGKFQRAAAPETRLAPHNSLSRDPEPPLPAPRTQRT